MFQEVSSLYAIVDIDAHQAPLRFVEKLLNAGLRLIQLRAKTTTDAALLQISKDARQLARMFDAARIIINDRVDIARLAEADGVHLGQDDLPPETAREILGADAIIGFSTHTLQQVQHAAELPVDYLGFGPVFASPTKQGHAEVTGLEELTNAAAASAFPIVAIGGITAARIDEVLGCGVAAVAMISELARTNDLERLVAATLPR